MISVASSKAMYCSDGRFLSTQWGSSVNLCHSDEQLQLCKPMAAINFGMELYAHFNIFALVLTCLSKFFGNKVE